MLDIALEEVNNGVSTLPSLCFNPSYAGYCPGSSNLIQINFKAPAVSILLMLDIALEGKRLLLFALH